MFLFHLHTFFFSIICLKIKMLSLHDLPVRKPPCSSVLRLFFDFYSWFYYFSIQFYSYWTPYTDTSIIVTVSFVLIFYNRASACCFPFDRKFVIVKDFMYIYQNFKKRKLLLVYLVEQGYFPGQQLSNRIIIFDNDSIRNILHVNTAPMLTA